MYLNYYRFKKEPFQVTPDPEFLFLSASHKEALASIIYGIEERKGFIAILGGVGVGKTTILRAYLEKVDRDRVKVIYIFNANLSFASLLSTIYRELGLIQHADDVFMMVNDLHEYLIDEYKKGCNVVLIIDEAQNMPIETLENLRMLSNLETATDKLIQIVLIGQPEFEDRLGLHALRQLRQRLAVRTVISPLNKMDATRYIEHRLSKVMLGDEKVLTPGAVREIVSHSKGIPRVINILCDNSFVTGYGYQRKPVTASIVREICADFGSNKETGAEVRGEYFFRWKIVAAFILVGAIALLAWISPYRGSLLEQVVPTQMSRPEVGKEAPRGKPEAAGKDRLGKMPQPRAKLPADSHATTEPGARDMQLSAKEAVAGQRTVNQTPAGQPGVKQRPAGPQTVAGSGRVVEKGDTLSRMIVARYGFFDSALLEKIKKMNPSISDVNKIYQGEKIVFPDE